VNAAYYPAITLNGSGGFNATQFSQWLVLPSRFWSIGSADTSGPNTEIEDSKKK